MMNGMLHEFRQEAATTKKVLGRVPGDKLAWRPHRKSMSLGQLALHIAKVPGAVSKISQLDEFDAAQANFNAPDPKNLQEIHSALEESIEETEEWLGRLTEEKAAGNWRLMANGKTIANQPRAEMLRSILLNHWYHHRGQLSVYLRMLDVPVPSIYGPSADENPFS
jgi:uncharacterized damage-inducible protein DinB